MLALKEDRVRPGGGKFGTARHKKQRQIQRKERGREVNVFIYSIQMSWKLICFSFCSATFTKLCYCTIDSAVLDCDCFQCLYKKMSILCVQVWQKPVVSNSWVMLFPVSLIRCDRMGLAGPVKQMFCSNVTTGLPEIPTGSAWVCSCLSTSFSKLGTVWGEITFWAQQTCCHELCDLPPVRHHFEKDSFIFMFYYFFVF